MLLNTIQIRSLKYGQIFTTRFLPPGGIILTFSLFFTDDLFSLSLLLLFELSILSIFFLISSFLFHFPMENDIIGGSLLIRITVLPLLIVCISVSDKGSMIFNLVDRILLTLSIFHFDLFHNIINHFFLFQKILTRTPKMTKKITKPQWTKDVRGQQFCVRVDWVRE